ncbi:hypothetical protein C8R45DRAFT_802459, partial [Mycena sanguinolenta]
VELRPHADFYKYALLEGRRLTPTTESRRNTAGSSLIQVRYHDLPFAGEIRYIFQHAQTGVVDFESPEILVRVEWMKTTNLTPLDNVTLWSDFPELGIETYEYNTYADPKDDEYPPIVMPLSKVHCQIARGKTTFTTPTLWITTTLDR